MKTTATRARPCAFGRNAPLTCRPARRSRAGAALLAAAGVLLAFAGCTKAPAPVPAAPPTPVELAPVVFSTVAVPVRAPAVLARLLEADLSFKIRGVVDTIAVRAGDAVASGQVLARLKLDEIDAQVAQARSALDKARRDLERVEKLEANRVATFENLQDARTAAEVASAQLQIAEFNRRFAVITAPEAGRILARRSEPGELVESGHAVLIFAADREGWIARAGLSDRDVVRVRFDDRVELGGGDAVGAPCTGRITHISAAADPATRTTPVEIALDAAPADARTGIVVPVLIHPRPVPTRPVVPASVLIEGVGDTATLFVVEPGTKTARRRQVQVDAIDGESAYLRTPLPPSWQLVVRGAEFLRDGAPVEPVK